MDAFEDAPSAAWRAYTSRRRTFATIFWLHYLLGIAGAHRFYVGRRASALTQMVMGLGSLLAIWALGHLWGAGAAVFLLPVVITCVWVWLDGYDLRDMVREHNRELAHRLGLDPRETEQWEESWRDQER